jgi:hypothetical protein
MTVSKNVLRLVVELAELMDLDVQVQILAIRPILVGISHIPVLQAL